MSPVSPSSESSTHPSPSSHQLKRKREQELAERRAKYGHILPGHMQRKMSASKAFESMTRRVLWLNQKIEESKDNQGRYDYYVDERDAIFWMMDKIRNLSKKLLEMEEEKSRMMKEVI